MNNDSYISKYQAWVSRRSLLEIIFICGAILVVGFAAALAVAYIGYLHSEGRVSGLAFAIVLGAVAALGLTGLCEYLRDRKRERERAREINRILGRKS